MGSARSTLARRSRAPFAESFAVGACTLAIVGAYIWLAQFGIDLADEGYFMDMATRVMHGQVPYRDFDTYYTPALFYLQAATFTVFGVSVVPARVLMILIRAGCGLVLYRLARRVAPWPFAILPPLLMVAVDLTTGSHPAWPALLGTLSMLELIASHACRLATSQDRSRRIAWSDVVLALAGVSAGLAFAFKQNVGAFAILGGLGYVALRPRSASGPPVILIRFGYVIAVALAVHRLLAPALDDLMAVTLWLPLLGTLLLLLDYSTFAEPSWAALPWPHAGALGLVREGAYFTMGGAVVTLVWLVPLLVQLGPSDTPFDLFLGNVKQGALVFPLEALPRGAPSLLIGAIWLAPAAAAVFQRSSRRFSMPLAIAILASFCVSQFPVRAEALNPLSSRPGMFERLEWLDLELGSLYLYLAPFSAWLGLLLLIQRRAMPLGSSPLVFYLLIGVLAQLALYPRADIVHALFAGAPLLVVGAWVLACMQHHLAAGLPRTAQAVVAGALLLVPLAAVAPHTYGRIESLLHPDPFIQGATYAPLGLARAPVLVAEYTAADLRAAVEYVTARTSPGEPFFAYPVSPLANVLADRPNPTRFDHFMPGALTHEDMLQVLNSLEQARPRFVLWDHAGVVLWETDKPNRVLSDYIWRCYHQVAVFRLFLILERIC